MKNFAPTLARDVSDFGKTLLTITSKAEAPDVRYSIVARVHDQTSKSVKVTIVIKSALGNSKSYFGNGFTLVGKVKINGTTKSIVLKYSTDYWSGTAIHEKSFTTTVNRPDGGNAFTISGITFSTYRQDNVGGKTGVLAETACADLVIPAVVEVLPSIRYLAPSSFGTGSNWHGPSITRKIPADASGDVGAKNFTLTYSQGMGIVNMAGEKLKYKGAFQVLLISGSGANRKIVAGVNVYKGGTGTTNANLRFYVNNKVMETTTINLDATKGVRDNSQAFFTDKKTSTITKNNLGIVTFDICGVVRSFRDSAITNTAVTEVTFTFSQFGSDPVLQYNGLFWAKFVKHNCDTWREIPNKFSTNDVVEADCKTGEIFLNGVSNPALGALGNDWEGFYLTPGVNQIGFSYSDWVKDEFAPRFRVKYREVFL